MPELIVVEKLQPCLLDRLTDDDPRNTQESRTQRVISIQRYRQGVMRDLEWLFGSSAHLSQEGKEGLSIQDFPEAFKSVINYGTRHLFGQSSPNLAQLQRDLTEALYNFEPRIIKNSLKVIVEKEGHSVLLDVHAELWANPLPEHLHIKSTLDIETGSCSVTG